MLHSRMNVEQTEVLDVYEDREDDSSVTQVDPSGEKAQLLKQMFPILHDIHSIGAKLDDTDMARELCLYICNAVWLYVTSYV